MIIKLNRWTTGYERNHHHEVVPATCEHGENIELHNSDEILIGSDNVAHGKISGVRLSGQYMVELSFSDNELQTWLKNKIEADPRSAMELLGGLFMQALSASLEPVASNQPDS